MPEPILPDYEGACIANVVAAIGAAQRGEPTPEWFPGAAARRRRHVLLVLDGLGWEQLHDRPTFAPTLLAGDGADRPATSVAPTTTATALTSIGTGLAPASHGVLGYRMLVDGRIFNVLRWQLQAPGCLDARRALPASTFQPHPTFVGFARPIPAVTRDGFGETGFTAAQLGDADVIGYRVESSLPLLVEEQLDAGAPFVFAYYDGIDKVAHQVGLGAYYDAELASIDALVARIVATLPPDAALVVTADHGQVDVGGRVVSFGAEILSLTAHCSGEGRFRWLHAVDGAAPELLEAARSLHGDVAWVHSRDELVDAGWFGGPLADGAGARLGDVALVPHEPVAFLDPADVGETRLAARHGSLTTSEMLVPLLAFDHDVPLPGGRGNITR